MMRWTVATAVLGVLLAATAAYARSAAVTRIQRTNNDWEVELNADQPFPMGAQPLVLKIGDRSFVRSIPQQDLKRVVFFLTDEEYDSVHSGDAMSVSYGRDADAQRWTMPVLDKGMAGGAR